MSARTQECVLGVLCATNCDLCKFVWLLSQAGLSTFLLTVSVSLFFPLCFCLAPPLPPIHPSTQPPTKQIKLFACASKSICVYQIVGLQTKNRKIAHTQSRKPNKNKDYCFATAVLLQGEKIKTKNPDHTKRFMY